MIRRGRIGCCMETYLFAISQILKLYHFTSWFTLSHDSNTREVAIPFLNSLMIMNNKWANEGDETSMNINGSFPFIVAQLLRLDG